MFKFYLILFVGFIFSTQTALCQLDSVSTKDKKGTLIDIRDGHSYSTIIIGEQTWMAENLAYKPNDGKYWAFDGSKNYVPDYGYLYSWKTAQEVCPAGWHLPDTVDIEKLLRFYKGDTKFAYNDLSITGKSGFNFKGGGFKITMDYIPLKEGAFWTTTESSKNKAWSLRLGGMDKEAVLAWHLYKKSGLSVRCIKDEKK